MGLISAVFELLAGIFGGLLEILFEIIDGIFSKKNKPVYDASFAHPTEIMSRRNSGFAFGTRKLDMASSYRGSLLYGNTGSGKNVFALVPSLLNLMRTSSTIVNDPSKELHKLCSGAANACGNSIRVLNLADATFGGYNMLRYARSTADYKKIAQLLIKTRLGGGKGDPYWNIAAGEFLAIILRVLQHQPLEFRTMHNALVLVNRFTYAPQDIDVLCVKTGDKALISDYKAYASFDRKMLMSIVATARAALDIFSDPQVAAATSYDTVDIASLRNGRVSLFIHSSIPDIKYYSPIISILFEQLFAEIMAEVPEKDATPIFYLIDECSSLTLPNMVNTYANIRKYKGAVMAAYQSPFQPIEQLGQAGARSLEENAYAKCYMPGVNMVTAAELEQTFGKTEYEDDKGIRHVKSLETASEIRLSKYAYLLCNNVKPIQLKVTPYYKQRKLSKLSKIPPYFPSNSMPFSDPPTISFE